MRRNCSYCWNLMPPRTDRSADRHRLRTLGRLDNPDDDAWLRSHAASTRQKVSEVVSIAVRRYRYAIENGENREQNLREG